MRKPTLPDVVHALFLAGDGFVGYRCDCGFVATGRSACAVDAAMNAHNRVRHLDETLQGEENAEAP